MSDEEKIVEKIATIAIACHRVLARKILQFCCARRFSGRVEGASRAVQDPLVPVHAFAESEGPAGVKYTTLDVAKVYPW